MKDFTLDIKQIAVLRQAHKNAITRSHAYRTYVQKYRDANVNRLLSNKYLGNNAKKLSDEQESELKQHLE